MSLFAAIFLIFLSFAGGYCLSGMLGAGTMEDIQRENSQMREEIIRLKNQNKALRKDMELIQKETRFKESIKV